MVPYTDATPMLADLDAGRIDIASNFTKTSDREARYLFRRIPSGHQQRQPHLPVR